jgi:quercetin dioxygenase-like cupin family protein
MMARTEKSAVDLERGNLLDPALRRITPTGAEHFRPDERYGRPLPGITRLPLSHDKASSDDVYLIRFAPGARSLPHEHAGPEEFLVLEGELVDSDGTVLKAGDFVHYDAGSKHHSVSPNGCLLLVILRQPNRPL